LASLVTSAACVPNLDTDMSTITEAQVLAIVADPPEAAPGQTVNYRALYVDPTKHEQDSLRWYYCHAPKPLAELGPVSQKCLSSASGALDRIGKGFETTGTMPTKVCSVFGPNPPLPTDGSQPGRPADPDTTGGYSQPVMLGVSGTHGEDILLYEQRVYCGLANVPPQLSTEYNQRYKKNVNPAIEALEITHADGSKERVHPGDSFEAKKGELLKLSLGWASCPQKDHCGDGLCGIDETLTDCDADCEEPKGCSGQERYLYYDTQKRELIERHEAMRVSWYATSGTYRDERTTVDEHTVATSSKDEWTAPEEAGPATLWIVLRDARGGVGYAEFTVDVN
jgi:hypothetical protein